MEGRDSRSSRRAVANLMQVVDIRDGDGPIDDEACGAVKEREKERERERAIRGRHRGRV